MEGPQGSQKQQEHQHQQDEQQQEDTFNIKIANSSRDACKRTDANKAMTPATLECLQQQECHIELECLQLLQADGQAYKREVGQSTL
jgi:hypothetical protein